MPTGALFGIEDANAFELAYRAHLDRIGVAAIDARFQAIAAEHSGPLVLLCFEQNRADCHRSTFARWWLELTGEPVPERAL